MEIQKESLEALARDLQGQRSILLANRETLINESKKLDADIQALGESITAINHIVKNYKVIEDVTADDVF